ncbi:MAG: putative DNA binding domain-containing protein [Candidatus Atribacteria bacterium]|nr:putative DNA binding domain-containing protein [Candidatus Atribacteria bacterium]MBN2747636.1 putative DNA binding domain-containing protein [Bacteroidales bacterium]
MPEHQNIEYKQSWHDDYLKWVCGFANAMGGVIYIGKDDSGKVVHLADYEKLLVTIPQKIRNDMGIVCDVNLMEDGEKKYIAIRVNPYSVPVSLRGRYYYRSGSVKTELTGVELNEFLLKKAGKTWDDVVEEAATPNDIDKNSLTAFIEAGREKGRMPDTNGLTTFQILDKLRLTDGEKLKRAAIILFGKDPNRFYPNIQVKIGRFGKDSVDLRFQEVVEGNLVYLLNEVVLQLNHKFLVRPVEFEGLQRVEKGEYPVSALREMLLNALVHRSYMGAPVQIRVYDHKLSIWNEGLLPMGIDVESLKREHSSRPRNPKIADACFKAGYIDSWGRGILKIMEACQEASLPEPEITEIDGGLRVTLIKSEVDASTSDLLGVMGGDRTSGQIGGQIGGQMGGQIHLTERQKEVYDLILLNDKISRREIAQKLEIAESAVQKHLKALTNSKIIERMGTNKGYWKVLVKIQ